MNNTNRTKNMGVNSGAREEQSLPASYKTPAVLFDGILYTFTTISLGRFKIKSCVSITDIT